jgi:hypothetical protein
LTRAIDRTSTPTFKNLKKPELPWALEFRRQNTKSPNRLKNMKEKVSKTCPRILRFSNENVLEQFQHCGREHTQQYCASEIVWASFYGISCP